VVYELKTAVFQVEDYLLNQKNRLPMGGFISAALAQLDSMLKEHTSRKLWRHLGFPSKWIRFRDDGRGFIGKCLEKCEIDNIEVLLSKIYGKNLKIVIEDWSYKEVVFLDSRVIINADKKMIEVRYYNKNLDFRKDDFKYKFDIVRFPEVNSGWNNVIFKGVMVGALKRVERISNTMDGYTLAMLELLWEWVTWWLSSLPWPTARRPIGAAKTER